VPSLNVFNWRLKLASSSASSAGSRKQSVDRIPDQGSCNSKRASPTWKTQMTDLHLVLLFWHAPLRMHSAKRRHQSPEWTWGTGAWISGPAEWYSTTLYEGCPSHFIILHILVPFDHLIPSSIRRHHWSSEHADKAYMTWRTDIQCSCGERWCLHLSKVSSNFPRCLKAKHKISCF